MAKITTISESTIDKMLADIEQLKRIVHGGLRGEELPLSRASDGVVTVPPDDGILARDGSTMYGELCYLYRVLDSDPTDNEISLEAILDGSGNCMRQRVFNASGSAFAGSEYAVSELLRSGHRYVNPSTDQRLKYWRATFPSVGNTTSGNTDISAYNGIELRFVGGGDMHPDVTVDTSAKTITFNYTGNYRIGVHVSISVNYGAVVSGATVSCDVGSFRSGTYYSTAEFTAVNLPQLTLPNGWASGDGSMTAFSESYIAAVAGDVLGVRFARTGDTSTSLNLYSNVTLGRIWV